MPDALVTIPRLQIPSENSSEIESNTGTASDVTDRSTDSRNGYCHTGGINRRIKPMEYQNKRNLKKHGRRSQKKSLLKPLISQQKVTNALKTKSQIPRAQILTASSSASTLANDSRASTLISVVKALTDETTPETNLTSRTCLVRQKSGVILQFRQRKSFTQMDFSHTRRQMQLPIQTSKTHLNNQCEDNKALMPRNCGEALTYPKNSFVHKMYNQDNYYLTMSGREPQMAGMRIFATIMLNAWRKRRDEVKHLMDEMSDLKRCAIKAKNQLHVFNTLFRVEQKRNDELNCQLKRSLEDINLTKSSCETLTTSVISLKADKALLEQQLLIKEQEFESLNVLLTQTKSDLFKSMTLQRELQASLSMEQRKIQTLENQKNELINEICELNNEAFQKEENLRNEIQEKEKEFSQLKDRLRDTEIEIKLLNESKEKQLNDSKAREERLQQEIETLENNLKIMNKCLEETFGKRFKNCWNNSLTYQKATLQMLHWLAYYVLPATPPPKMKALPFELSLDKALSIIKR